MNNCNKIVSKCENQNININKNISTICQRHSNEKFIGGLVKICKDKNDDDANTQMQPKSCDQLWNRCKILCSTINSLERIKYIKGGCCVTSPIPTGADYFKPLQPPFSKRTTFSYYRDIVVVDQRCTCVKFNGIEEICKHPLCKNNMKCLSRPSPLCLPAQNWKKYYGQTE